MAGYGTGCIWEAGEINKHLLTHNCINLLYQQSKCNFTAKYLSGAITKSLKEQCMDFGYAIWREFIADYISYKVKPIMRPLSFAQMREVVRELDPGVCVSNPEQTVNASLILAHIFVHPKIQEAKDIETVPQALKGNRTLDKQHLLITFKGGAEVEQEIKT